MIKKIIENFGPFIKYCAVGASGTFIDLASLYIFVEYFFFPVIPAAILSFILAVTNNFILNKIWTFKNRSKNYRKLYLKFLIVSVVGLGLTVAGMHVMTNIIGIWYMLAKVLTSAVVLSWNFLANKFWTFHLVEKLIISQKKFSFRLSIIIPAYDEANRIKNTLLIIKDYLEQSGNDAEIIVVNDGSTDATKEIIEKYQQKIPNLKLINLTKNCGKGFAVKTGVEKAQGEYILFTDADNSTPIEESDKLMEKMQTLKADIAIGSRYLKSSKVHIAQPNYRILMGRVGNFFIRLFLIDGIRDTQCGFKLFKNKIAKEIFSFQKVRRFAFDMEILTIANNLGYRIAEVPVSWFNSPESRVRPIKDMLRTFKDLIYIKLNLWSGRYSSD